MGFVQTPDWTTPVTQEIGGTPGHPPAKVFTGTRGMSLEAVDPHTGSLSVAWAQFQPAPAGSFLALQPIGTAPNPEPRGVPSLVGADIQGTGGIATLELGSLAQLQPGEWYQVVMVRADGGGAGENIQFSGDQAHQWAAESQTVSSTAAPAGAAPSASSSPAAAPAASPLTSAAPSAAGQLVPVGAGGGSSWFSGTTLGLPNWVLVLGGAVIAAEML